MDERVKKTRTAFRQALFTLLDHKAIDAISVSELCRQAGVTRRTFYIHYDQVSDIFSDYQEDMAEQVAHAMHAGKMDPDSLLTIFDQILTANFKAFRYLCQHPQQSNLIPQLTQMLVETFASQLIASRPTASQTLILQYAASGLINAYVYWFDHEDTIDYQTVVKTNRQLLASTLAQLNPTH